MDTVVCGAGSDGIELFVPGRLCILGEHSDWAAKYSVQNPAVPCGYCLVCATNEGLYARVHPYTPGLLRFEFRSKEGAEGVKEGVKEGVEGMEGVEEGCVEGVSKGVESGERESTYQHIDLPLSPQALPQLRALAQRGVFFSYVAGTAMVVLQHDKFKERFPTFWGEGGVGGGEVGDGEGVERVGGDGGGNGERSEGGERGSEGAKTSKTLKAVKTVQGGIPGLRIDNYHTTLPMGKGLSSSAAVCVLVARAMDTLGGGLGLTQEDLMEVAYRGEGLTPSMCGRMDQCVVMGSGVGLMQFSGQTERAEGIRGAEGAEVEGVATAEGAEGTEAAAAAEGVEGADISEGSEGIGGEGIGSWGGAEGTGGSGGTGDTPECTLRRVGVGAPLHFVVVDLCAGKDTVAILQDLHACFPFPSSPKQSLMHQYVRQNVSLCQEAVGAIEAGDVGKLGRLMRQAQRCFDEGGMPNCVQLTSPVLHRLMADPVLVGGGRGGGADMDMGTGVDGDGEGVGGASLVTPASTPAGGAGVAGAWGTGGVGGVGGAGGGQGLALAVKGVGSQGDGTAQVLCGSEALQQRVIGYVTSLKMHAFKLTIPKQ